MPVEIEEFGDFAETTLNNHLVELHSLLIQSGSYQDELMTEKDY
ncbi:MAG: hypothetical protein ABUL44_00055 [Flavobacterium sp.]